MTSLSSTGDTSGQWGAVVKTLRVGIVGTGFIARTHVDSFRRLLIFPEVTSDVSDRRGRRCRPRTGTGVCAGNVDRQAGR